MSEFLNKLADAKAVFFHLDGILTNGTFIQTNSGVLLRNFNQKDLLALKICARHSFITGTVVNQVNNEILNTWLEWGLGRVYVNHLSHLSAYESFILETASPKNKVIFIGSDITDLPTMRDAYCSITTPNASMELKQVADYTCESNGGEGVLYEVVELIFKAKNLWKF
jgi:3-deoxy-D-manno-octulosonate 8-phosphate phosphatase (KDO 8-P phosphatase)